MILLLRNLPVSCARSTRAQRIDSEIYQILGKINWLDKAHKIFQDQQYDIVASHHHSRGAKKDHNDRPGNNAHRFVYHLSFTFYCRILDTVAWARL